MYRWGVKLFGLKISESTPRRKSGWKSCQNVDVITDEIRENYVNSLLPLENLNGFHDFHSPKLLDSDFNDKPSVLLIGKYSVGKTTLLKDILECEYPGMRIGPEPTTECFNAVIHGDREAIIPGPTAITDKAMPFRHLKQFGTKFFKHFQCSTLKNEVTKAMTFIDTPGIGTLNKCQKDVGYDVMKVLQSFSEKADRIIVMFDAQNTDISDALRDYLQGLGKHGAKVRIVLNKADTLHSTDLIKVYGALMWSLSKVLPVSESPRIFVGSFWNGSSADTGFFELERCKLLDDFRLLPYSNFKEKLFDLCRRIEVAKVHAYLTSYLKSKLPFIGRDKVKRKMIENLRNIYMEVEAKHNVFFGGFPDITTMQKLLTSYNWDKFKNLDDTLIENANVFRKYVTNIVVRIPNKTNNNDSDIAASRPDGDMAKPTETMDRSSTN